MNLFCLERGRGDKENDHFLERGFLPLNQIVIKANLKEIQEMQKYYQANLTEKIPPGAVFAAKTSNCTITAYKSGKVLFQGTGCQDEAGLWNNGKTTKNENTQNIPKNTGLPANFGSLSVIGSDETGSGDYFGPVTVVAAYVKKDHIPFLQELGVKDSKSLNDHKIIAIAKQIKDVIPHSLLVLHNEKYNDLQKSGMTQGKMKALLHNQAIGHVLKKIAPEQPDAVLIDQFAEEEVYYRHLTGQKEIYRKNVYFRTKAEGLHLSVAAASILARYAFVSYFEQLSKKAGFTLPKGAGPEVDKAAAKLIREKGSNILYKFAKLHFANTKKAMTLAEKITDSSF